MNSSNFGEFRSAMHSGTPHALYQAWNVAFGLENPGEREVAFTQLVQKEAAAKGENFQEAEYTFRNDNAKVRNIEHMGYEELIERLVNFENCRMTPKVTVNPTIYVGMPATFRINGDRYPGIITFVSKNGKTVKFLSESMYEAMVENGQKWEGEGAVYTRRERRNTGHRGWAEKGASINSIKYSGLIFGKAERRMDRGF